MHNARPDEAAASDMVAGSVAASSGTVVVEEAITHPDVLAGIMAQLGLRLYLQQPRNLDWLRS